MNVNSAFLYALFGCLAALAGLLISIVGVRAMWRYQARASAARVRRWRPVVMEWMHASPTTAVVPRRGSHRRAAVGIAVDLLPKLRGADRSALVAVLEQSGAIDLAVASTASRRSVVRHRAVVLLDAVAREADVPVLIRSLTDRDPEIRVVAARALGRIGSPASIPALMRGLQSRQLPSNTVSMAIVRIGPDATHRLLGWMYSEDPHCRQIAAELLGFLGALDAAFDLVSALDDPAPSVRRSAARSLGRLGLPATVPALVARLQREYDVGDRLDRELCSSIAQSLGHIGDRRAIPILTASLARSHRLSSAAGLALAAMGPRRSLRSERARAELARRSLEHEETVAS